MLHFFPRSTPKVTRTATATARFASGRGPAFRICFTDGLTANLDPMDDAPNPETPRETPDDVGIRITSDPDTTEIIQPDRGEARASSPLPMRLLLVSDLLPQRDAPADWEGEKHVHRVDPNRFPSFMAEMAPRLTLDVPNTMSESAKTLTVNLTFTTLDAFHPDQIVRAVPALAQMLGVRASVRAVGAGEIDLDAFRTRLQDIGIDADWAADLYRVLDAPDPASETPPASESSEGDDSLDRLLGMVDTEPEAASGDEPAGSEEGPDATRGWTATNGDVGASTFIGALMEAVSEESTAARADASAVADLDALLTSVLAEQVETIITQPAFRRLEASWRGLKFLVDRLRFRDDVRLDVLPAAREDLHEAIHFQALVPEHSGRRKAPPFSLMVVDVPFGHSHRDTEQLRDLAETGASLQVPVLTTVRADFFGVEKVSGLAKVPALRPYLQQPEYVEWNALRDEQAAQYLALALPAFLLRYPYGPDNAVEAFALEEREGLWGSGALVVAAAAAHSFAETGWPTHLADYPIEDLPVQPGRGGHSPLETLLPGSKRAELAQAGFVVLGGRPNHDAVRVVHAPTVRRPHAAEGAEGVKEARAHASLPCRLFVTRAAHFVLMLQDGIEPGTPVERVQEEAAAALRVFLGVRDDEEETDGVVAVERLEEGALPEHEVLAVRLRPPAHALGQDVRLVLGLRVSRAA